MNKTLLIISICVSLAIFGDLLLDRFYRDLLIEILIYFLLAQSVNLLYGYMGSLSFGQSFFFGLSSSIVAMGLYYTDQPLFFILLISLLSCFLGSIIFSYALTRLEGHNFVIFSVLFSLFPLYLSNAFSKFTGGDDGLSLVLNPKERQILNLIINNHEYNYYLIISVVTITSLLTWKLYRTPFSLISKGIRENQFRMILLGYNVDRHKLIVYIISGTLAGISGVLYVFFSKYISSSYFHWSLSGEAVIWGSLIGRGTFFGPLFGTTLLVLTREELSSFTGVYHIIVGFLLILCVSYSKSIDKIKSAITDRFQNIHGQDVSMTSQNHQIDIYNQMWLYERDRQRPNYFECKNINLKINDNFILKDISLKASLETGLTCSIHHKTIQLPKPRLSERIMSIAIVGENGTGKTTLLNVISGLQKEFDGDFIAFSPPERNKLGSNNQNNKCKTGRTFQRPELFANLSVEANILLALQSSKIKDEAITIQSIINFFKMKSFIKKRVSEISYGQMKIVELALVYSAKCQLIILDEPLNGVGAEEKHVLIEIIKQLSLLYPLVLVEHDPTVVKNLTDYMVFLDDGAISNAIYSKNFE